MARKKNIVDDRQSFKQKVLDAYSDGSPLGLIIESFNTTHKQISSILLEYKEDSRHKKTFTDEFKKMIAERDMNGVTRSSICSELQLSATTVRKACEAFGQSVKEKATSDKAFTRINGEFKMDTCPSCGSKKNNLVDEKTTYCMSCDSEHEYYDGYVLKINFEYIEE